MIEIKNLTKTFGLIRAVDDITLTVPRGQVLGFLGPNGAGKSTTMKIVTGFLQPTSGRVSVCGHNVLDNPLAAQRAMGYLPEGAPLYAEMTAEALLHFCAEARGYRGADKRRIVRDAAERVHLEGVMRQPIETLSKGYKRRVGLAQAIMHDPEVLILDEPTDGLDPNQKHEVRTLIREMAGHKVIVLSTHILEEVEAVCDRAVVIAHGRLVGDGTPADLQARSTYHNAVNLVVTSKPDGLLDALQALPNVAHVEHHDSHDGRLQCTVLPSNGKPIVTDVSELLRSRGAQIERLQVEAGRLDEVFRKMTTQTDSTDAKTETST